MATQELLVSGVTELLKILGSVVSRQINQAWGAHDDLKKLEETLEMIAAVTTDAEEQQEISKLVQLWLKRLNDVVFDADDVLDEFAYEAMRQKELCGKRSKVRQLFSPCTSVAFNCKMSRKMGRNIKNINTRLDDISTEIEKYNLHFTPLVNTYDLYTVQQNRELASLVNESTVIGRDTDKSAIIDMLTTVQESAASSSLKFSVVSIVGMGGLGKTALARLVYKDDLVERSFEKTGWVCVSDDFNIKKILMKIIESVTNKKCDDYSNHTVLVDKFRKELSNKKYLLVLDDLWNEDAEEWNTLERLLCVGAQGSRVLVTTRSDKVASIVEGAISPYVLGKLPDIVCWSIIKSKAFSPGGAIETPNLICIGKKIAESCGGLPLAANFLGNVLRLCKTETDWQSILDDDSFKKPEKDKIISILKLSYDKLPSHLKLCFSYCSLFPKDWDIDRKVLVRLWMAEGFLHLSHGENQISLEDVGDSYFHSLLANSFFQDVTSDTLGDVRTCKMHDLVHDLAQRVSGVHDIKVVNSCETESISQYRRFLLEVDVHTSKVLEKIKRPRSIFSLQKCDLGEFILYGKSLRVVCLLSDFELDFPGVDVHSLIFKHKHMRYLDLSYCSFNEGRNVSINQLYNLQTLVLHECENVKMILVGIGALKILRHLDLSCSDVKEFDVSIVQLTNLQTLDLTECRELVALPEHIGSLKYLRELKIKYCGKLNVLPTEVGKLTRLRCLELCGTKVGVLPESCINNLCNLEFIHFGHCKLPKEIKNLSKLRILKHYRENEDEIPRGIETLTGLEVLYPYLVRDTSCSGGGGGIEELANLNSLQVLKILNLEFVRGVIDARRAKLEDKTDLGDLCLEWGTSAFNDDNEMPFDEVLEGLKPHPNLTELEIHDFPGSKLPKWMGSPSCLPNLVEINFWCCDNCEKLPAVGMLPCLRILNIWGMRSVKCLGDEFYYQQEEDEEERISSSSNAVNATTVSLFPSLISLTLSGMINLEEWVPPRPTYNLFSSLENLSIRCPKLNTTPKSFSILKELNLYLIDKAVSSIFSTTGGLTSLKSVKIDGCKNLYIPLGVLLKNITPNLQKLSIESCSKLQGFVDDDDLNNYNNKDGDDDDDDEAILPFSCPEINSNSKNTSNSLRSLTFRKCPFLTLLPDLRSFTSLRELIILGCDKLKESMPYDLKTLTFLEMLEFDFVQREYEHPEDLADKS